MSHDAPVARCHLVTVTSAMRALIRARMDALGVYAYRELAERTGGQISHMSIHRIMTAQQTRCRARTLHVLAEALGMTHEELLAASGTDAAPWLLPETFDRVPASLRPAIERALQRLMELGGLLDSPQPPDV